MQRVRKYTSKKRTSASEKTRQRIVTAALQMLARGKSGAELSLDKVAARARVTRKTVYDHFDNRAGLIEAVFDEAARRGGLFGLAKAFTNPDPAAALHEFVATFCRFLASLDTALPNLAIAVGSDPDLARRMAKRAERRRRGLALLLRGLGLGGDKDLVDVLFAVTTMEFFDAMKREGRSPAEVANLVEDTVETLVASRLARKRIASR